MKRAAVKLAILFRRRDNVTDAANKKPEDSLQRAETRHKSADFFSRHARVLAACAAVFLLALGVRALHWQDNRHAFPYTGMAEEYRSHALTLYQGKLDLFLRGPDPPSDANFVKHPPGYPIFQAAIYTIFGLSDTPVRALHVALDAAAAVLVLLIAFELFGLTVGTIAGLLVALSPQLAYHSITLVPDPVTAPPLLLAFYLLARAVKRPRLLTVAAAGALIGVSCLLRSNALLLAPFLALLTPLLFERGQRLRSAASLVGACLVVILPVTIRNAVVYRSFIPLSLSAGITFVEGIGIYDREGRFGLPSSDYGVTKWEAEMYGRPDYLGTRFHPDGVERERRRIEHALSVVRRNPFWFSRVMAHRAFSMWRLTRVELIAPQPTATNSLALAEDAQAAWALSPDELKAGDVDANAHVELSTTAEADALVLTGDRAENLLISPPVGVKKNTDYLLRFPLKVREGSVVIEIIDAHRNSVLASSPVQYPIHYLDFTNDTQPFVSVQRPFTSSDAEAVRLRLRSGDTRPPRVVLETGRVEAFDLGHAAHTWTRYPRLLLRPVQKLFLTATVLPLAALGLIILARTRRWTALALLLALPIYYMCTQSALWTEFRYILAMHYFILILAAAGLHWAATMLWRSTPKLKRNTD